MTGEGPTSYIRHESKADLSFHSCGIQGCGSRLSIHVSMRVSAQLQQRLYWASLRFPFPSNNLIRLALSWIFREHAVYLLHFRACRSISRPQILLEILLQHQQQCDSSSICLRLPPSQSHLSMVYTFLGSIMRPSQARNLMNQQGPGLTWPTVCGNAH